MTAIRDIVEFWKSIYRHNDKATIHQRPEQQSPLPPELVSTRPEQNFAWEIETQDVIVVPSLSFSAKELETIEGLIHYEERALFVIFALTTPGTRVTFVTSAPLDESIVQYHFSLLAMGSHPEYKNRISFYSVCDSSTDRCLTEKILSHPRLLERLKRGWPDHQNPRKHHQRILMVYRATQLEEKLANILDMPYYSARPEQVIYGTKPGSRMIFKTLGIPCPDGTIEKEQNLEALFRSIWRVLLRNPTANRGVIKLSDGFSGMGNSILDLEQVQTRIKQKAQDGIDDDDELLMSLTMESFRNATFHHRTWEDFLQELHVMGGCFEIFIDQSTGMDCGQSDHKRTITSPSVQCVVNEDGSVFVLSTHEQVLQDQVYNGCEFPCQEGYRYQLMEYGRRIGNFLAEHGVNDHFGVDFLCVPRLDDGWDIYAVEINLRLTGTTHPWMTMKLLTHGETDQSTGLFRTPSGEEKFYVSSDHVADPSLKTLLPQDLHELMIGRQDLHWNPNSQTGAIFHMLGRMSESGVVSMTAIGNSLSQAHQLFEDTRTYIVREAKENLASNII